MMKKPSSLLVLSTILFVVSACSLFEEGVTPSAPVSSDSSDSDSSDSESTSNPPPFSTEQLMTAQDVVNSTYSNISITNAAGASITASGLYIASFDANDCSACTGAIISGNNAMGTLVQPVTFGVGQSIQLGQNFLYNLIYNGIYFVSVNIGAPPCLLPGCSWPGDNGTLVGWCLSVGVTSLDASYTSSTYVNGSYPPANVVPYGAAVTSNPFDYVYDLVDPATLGTGSACLGPIVCDDATLTCTVSTPQSQSFQSY